jgi:hypothetical protein
LVGVLGAGGLGRPAYPIRARALCDPMPVAGLMYERCLGLRQNSDLPTGLNRTESKHERKPGGLNQDPTQLNTYFVFRGLIFYFFGFPQHVYWMVAMITIDLHKTRETLDLHHLSAEFRYKIAIPEQKHDRRGEFWIGLNSKIPPMPMYYHHVSH